LLDLQRKYGSLKEILVSFSNKEVAGKELKTEELILVVKELREKSEEKIDYLEARVQELINLIKDQKQKIVNAFTRLLPGKELLQKLIEVHLELTRIKKQETDSSDYNEQCEEYEKQY